MPRRDGRPCHGDLSWSIPLFGLAGRQGLTGKTGSTGARGPSGATGSAGPRGNTGSLGYTGATGRVGARGSTGWCRVDLRTFDFSVGRVVGQTVTTLLTYSCNYGISSWPCFTSKPTRL